MKTRVFEIRVPATTANLGPGFDSLGLAMRVYNTVTVTVGGEEGMEITGIGAEGFPRDGNNLMVRSAMILAERAGRTLPPLHWHAVNGIPPARGMGSSSAAIVSGLLAADAALDLKLGRDDLVRIAAEIEEHPDNVAPALRGGLTICMPESRPLQIVCVRPDRRLRLALLVPDYQLSTDRMRQVLPKTVPYADAVFNLGRSAAMVAALEHGIWGVLRQACEDRLHESQRLHLVRGRSEAAAAAYNVGALGVALSGSGPTIVALCTSEADEVAAAMLAAMESLGVAATTIVTQPDLDGATVTQKE